MNQGPKKMNRKVGKAIASNPASQKVKANSKAAQRKGKKKKDDEKKPLNQQQEDSVFEKESSLNQAKTEPSSSSDLQQDKQLSQQAQEYQPDIQSTDYSSVRTLVRDTNLNNKDVFEKFAGGVTKQAYGVKDKPWVVLAVEANGAKERVLRAEVEQLLKFRESGLDIPDIGNEDDIDSAIFPIKIGEKTFSAFLEQKVEGFEIKRNGTAFSEDEVKEFGNLVSQYLVKQGTTLEQAQQKHKAALESIRKLINYLEKEDIPDFQVRYDEATGRILVLDPGDPITSQNAREKHLKWLGFWENSINNPRFLRTEWNKNNPNQKISLEEAKKLFSNE